MRTKRMMLGTISEIIPYFINGILGIIKINILITYLGSSLNGYYQFINQIIAYLFLMEAGFTAAVTYQMYKPFADGDKEKINEIYTGSRDIFRKIGFIISGLVFIGVLIILFTTRAEKSVLVEILLTFVLICVSYLIPFFGKQNAYEAILSSDQKSYVFSAIFNCLKIVNDLFIIFLVMKFKSLIVIGLSILVIKVLQEIILRLVCNKIYPWLKMSENKDLKALEMTKHVAWNKFGYLISNNIDSVIVMYVLGPISVSVYSAYNYIASYLSEFISRINGVIALSFGNVFAKGEKERSYSLFQEYYTLTIFLAFTCSLTFFFGIRPFMSNWLPDAIYQIRTIDAMMFSYALFFIILFSPLHSMINANGLYKESKNFVFVAAIVNLVLSLLLVRKYSFAGLLGATAISYLISNYLKGKLVFDKVFDKKAWNKLIKEYIFCIIIFTLIVNFGSFIEELIFYYSINFINTFICLGLCFVILAILTLLILYIFKKNTKDLFSRIYLLFKKKKI